MAMQTMSANRHDSRQDASGAALPYGSQPGSPTLTNPDMILPDYNDLVGYTDLSQSHQTTTTTTWNSGHSIEDGFQFHDNGFYVNPDPLSTPIIYGNGTMLSDIGEVTEVESNAGTIISRNASRRTVQSFDDDAHLRPSPATGMKFVPNKSKFIGRDRRLSNESTSTLNTLERNAFADFDDALSVGGDSNFQGDDEESMASSYAEEQPVPRPLRTAKKKSVQRLSDEGSVSISKRAEEILANAKQRLTNMEDNLTRARTLSYSAVSDDSTPSPPIGRSATTSYRAPAAPPAASGHSRNMSENGLASSRVGGFPQRSASALGQAGGYRRGLPGSRSVDALNGATNRGAHAITSHQLDTPLEPLGEDEYAESIVGRIGGLGSPTFGTFSDTGSARSSVQMRDIQDQMKGLKGKISTLREQARADSLKRRSLQSLRTPTPLNQSTWESGSRSTDTPDENNGASLGETNGNSNGNTRKHVRENSQSTIGSIEARAKEVLPNHPAQGPEINNHQSLHNQVAVALGGENMEMTDDDDASCYSGAALGSGNDGAVAEVAPQGYESESGESLYHDSFQHQVSHEDREDAFDYERFFLHSAMSSIRSRSGSMDSNDSVETTRGPVAPRRRPSVDTIASAESFETAAEAVVSRSSTAQGYRVYTAAELFNDARPDSGASFGDSSSGSDSNVVYGQNGHRRQGSVVHRPASIISVSTRPSYSSFESTGTNRSFPLVNKTKRNSGILTPGSSPDHGLKQTSETVMNDAASIHETEDSSRGQSPAIQVLSPTDQSSVEALVASLGKCVLVLGEPKEASIGAHDLYRRRIEMARRILEGELEIS
ncbi:hypothetical protein PT974_08828 [Cladobotryum mycophilum]|uniref:Cep57 centrosome microtubule-binding domain-containing protein n=1 Tax=Cladobotryum mycophilum TaxID=491253 RepID=A0ABR0SF01_9HYPO